MAADGTSDELADRCDDAVVGAGITGLVTAVVLARAGRDVCVLEARAPGAAASGRNTGKISLLQGTRLSQVARHQSEDVAAAYLAANRAGLDWLWSFCEEAGVPVQERIAATYAASPRQLRSVRQEHDLAVRLGLGVGWSDEPLDGVPHAGAVTLPGQVQVDPARLVDALVDAVRAAGGKVVTGARVRRLGPLSSTTLHVEGGRTLQARNIVIATGSPVVDRGLQVTQLTPARSYIVAHRWSGTMTHMSLSAGSDSRSLRDAVDPDGHPLLLVGGAGHTVGRTRDERRHLERLRAWTADHFPDAEEVAAWSAQDHSTTSGVPLVGRMPLSGGVVRIATGFAKWGLTNGAAAGLAIAGDVLGGPELGHPTRYLGARPEPLGWLRHNAVVGARMAGDYASVALPRPHADVRARDLARACGVCPHMGGLLRWNDAEETWDCPLHGSRFSPDGSVLEGPAERPARVPPALGRRH